MSNAFNEVCAARCGFFSLSIYVTLQANAWALMLVVKDDSATSSAVRAAWAVQFTRKESISMSDSDHDEEVLDLSKVVFISPTS